MEFFTLFPTFVSDRHHQCTDRTTSKHVPRPPSKPPSLPSLPVQKASAPAASRAFNMPAFENRSLAGAGSRAPTRPPSSGPSSSSSVAGSRQPSMGPPAAKSSSRHQTKRRVQEADEDSTGENGVLPQPPSKKQRTSDLSEVLRRLEILEQHNSVSTKTFEVQQASWERSTREQDTKIDELTKTAKDADSNIHTLRTRLEAVENTCHGPDNTVGATPYTADLGTLHVASTSSGGKKPRENVFHHMLRAVFRHAMGILPSDPFPDPLEGARDYWLEIRDSDDKVTGRLLRPKWHADWDEANSQWWPDLFSKITNDGANIFPTAAGILKTKTEGAMRDVFRKTTFKNSKDMYRKKRKPIIEQNRIDEDNKRRSRKKAKSEQLTALRPTLDKSWQVGDLDFAFHPMWQSSDDSEVNSSDGDSDGEAERSENVIASGINQEMYPTVYYRRTQDWCSDEFVTRKDLLHKLLRDKNMKTDGKKKGKKKLITPRVKGKLRKHERLPFVAGTRTPAWAVSHAWLDKYDDERARVSGGDEGSGSQGESGGDETDGNGSSTNE
ncbi:hypothetical protein OF83DRAFT_1153407 [Amylostereum chailletii]|nr:hypothetical protein OF83DRAFT_1153407 [Amylostereum chailletii]